MNFALTRNLIIFGLVLPLAAVVGYFLATPDDRGTFLLIAAVAGLLVLPIMLKWYHPLLIFSWNAWITIFFLPGRPELWMLITAIGFGIVVLNSTLDREKTLIHVPPITYALLFFLMVVLVTAKLTGGIGVRALGKDQIGGGAIGGRGYFNIIAAALGYFVLTSRVVPLHRVKTYLSLFFLSGTTAMFSNLAYMFGPAFYFLFYLFPVELAMSQALEDWGYGSGIMRIVGFATAGSALYFLMMARYGIGGILDLRRPFRIVGFAATLVISLLGGFRSLIITYIIHFTLQFYLEGLVRTRLCAILVVGGIGAGALLFPFANKLPLPVQRCVAFVPGIEVSSLCKADAENSTRWRVEMWSILLPEVPKYLILGKGYSINPADLYLTYQAERRGLAKNYESALVGGSYHNGPLSIIIPFGIFGVIGFLWSIGAGIWALYRNYRYGDPELRVANTFLLAYFLMRVIVFLFIFGGMNSELFKFTGVLGLSVAINRGVRKPADTPLLEPAGVNVQPAAA